jgi:hypothetical protein
MPVERRSGRQQAVAVAVGVVALVAAVGLAWLMIDLASGGDGPVQVRLGDDVFDAGQATRISAQIAQDGPILYSDVSGRGQQRPIVVNHFGDDPKQRWAAFGAAVPGSPENCFLSWNAERYLFEERAVTEGAGREQGEVCRDVTVSADGSSASDGSTVERFPWRIDDNDNLIIDLRPPDQRTTTTVG